MQIDHRLFSEIENELKVISVSLLILQKYTCPGGAADVGFPGLLRDQSPGAPTGVNASATGMVRPADVSNCYNPVDISGTNQFQAQR